MGDVTGDGRLDLVAHAPGSHSLRVFPRTGVSDGGLKAPEDLAGLPSDVLAF